jgi:hypothetical protein
MLLTPKDTVDINLFYKRDGRTYLVLTEEELVERVKELENIKKKKVLTEDDQKQIEDKLKFLGRDKFDTLSVQMKVLTWGDYNQFQDNATRTLPDGERHFDYKRYKEDRLKHLIVSWDLKDEAENVIEFNPRLLSNLPYQVGEAIIRGFDEVTYYDEEREKN